MPAPATSERVAVGHFLACAPVGDVNSGAALDLKRTSKTDKRFPTRELLMFPRIIVNPRQPLSATRWLAGE